MTKVIYQTKRDCDEEDADAVLQELIGSEGE
jgi:hypothetical protein